MRVYASCKKLDGESFGWDDINTVPVNSRQFLLNYGWKQWQADAHAADKRENFPTGVAGTEAWQDSVRTHIMERHDVITTGVGLPGEKAPSLVAKLAEETKAREAAEAVVTKMRAKLVDAGFGEDEIEAMLEAA